MATNDPVRLRRRRGLSTLEMVLSLPILLFVMALMINYGTVACWKVRALSVARNAVWSTRWPRTGHSNPRPNIGGPKGPAWMPAPQATYLRWTTRGWTSRSPGDP